MERHLPRSALSRTILNFTPSWYSVTMGTGFMSILLHTSPHKFHGEAVIGTVLYFANILLFFLFTVTTVARYAKFPWAFSRMIKHSSQSLFLGTIPMGLATIVNATVLIAVPKYGTWAAYFCWGLWWLDVLLTVLCVLGIPTVMFQVHTLSLDAMTAAWLLPIVPAIVCAASGDLVASVLPELQALLTLCVSYVLWGIGMLLSLLIMALYFHRLAVHHLPNSEVIVSAFLPLGPCGQGAFGVVQLGKVASEIFNGEHFARNSDSGTIVFVISVLSGLLIWGLGLWWLFHGIASVSVRMLQARLRFNMGFWGFIFPLGVFIAATIALGESMRSAFLSYLSVIFLVCLAILFIFVASYTIIRGLTGDLLVAPCMSDLSWLSYGENGKEANDTKSRS